MHEVLIFKRLRNKIQNNHAVSRFKLSKHRDPIFPQKIIYFCSEFNIYSCYIFPFFNIPDFRDLLLTLLNDL